MNWKEYFVTNGFVEIPPATKLTTATFACQYEDGTLGIISALEDGAWFRIRLVRNYEVIYNNGVRYDRPDEAIADLVEEVVKLWSADPICTDIEEL